MFFSSSDKSDKRTKVNKTNKINSFRCHGRECAEVTKVTKALRAEGPIQRRGVQYDEKQHSERSGIPAADPGGGRAGVETGGPGQEPARTGHGQHVPHGRADQARAA